MLLKTDMRESKILKAICVYVKRYVSSTENMEDIKIMKLISGTNLSSGWLLYGSRDEAFYDTLNLCLELMQLIERDYFIGF